MIHQQIHRVHRIRWIVHASASEDALDLPPAFTIRDSRSCRSLEGRGCVCAMMRARQIRRERRRLMARPVPLFTGRWADLTLEEPAAGCGEWSFDARPGRGWASVSPGRGDVAEEA
jgi:hypothetical protein